MAETPYRDDEKALRDLIPPDDRKRRATILIVASMIFGGGLVFLGQALVSWATRPTTTPPPQPFVAAGALGPVTLSGPGGAFRVPAERPVVLHVWLQGCADCMPAFDSMFALQATGGLNLPVEEINVAYGSADEAWARAHGVGRNLVLDHGGRAVVRPAGISSFTTLVVDTRGDVVHRDRPDKVGYAVRVEEALRRLGCYPGSQDQTGAGCASRTAPRPKPTEGALSPRDFVYTRVPSLRQRCWTGEHAPKLPRAESRVTIAFGADGRVTRAEARGTSPEVDRCLEREIHGWTLGHETEPVTLEVPFQFMRQGEAPPP